MARYSGQELPKKSKRAAGKKKGVTKRHKAQENSRGFYATNCSWISFIILVQKRFSIKMYNSKVPETGRVLIRIVDFHQIKQKMRVYFVLFAFPEIRPYHNKYVHFLAVS